MRSRSSPTAASSTMGPGHSKRQSKHDCRQAFEVDTVRPEGQVRLAGLHPGARMDRDRERRSRQKPATGCSGTGSESTAVTTQSKSAAKVSLPEVTGAIDQRALPFDQIKRQVRIEIAGVDGHTIGSFGRQFRRRANQHRDVVASGERQAQHVPTERAGSTKNQ